MGKKKKKEHEDTQTAPFRLRDWQIRAKSVIRSISKNSKALVYACPGAGKTIGALAIVEELIRKAFPGSVIVVITPNLAIKSQWIDRARIMGIDLIPVKSGDDLRQSMLELHATGFITSYQQVVNLKHSLREFCERNDVIVILDEVHHTEGPRTERDGNAWGHAVEYACSPAKFKLCTTGTPFRDGNNPIAFVQYDDNREAICQFSYTYENAIKDGVCRPIEFIMFDGEVTWRDKGSTISASFADKLSKKAARQRLRAAVSEDGNFPRTLLAAAHAKLEEIRRGEGSADKSAAALILACDTEHAEALADEWTAIAGERPVIVHNKIDEAQELIAKFRDGNAKCIIGINMLSEGVDIPRLRVGVYVSNIRAALYFHQFCGRMMRVQESAHERSFIFMPADSELEAIALTIEKERCHALGEEYKPRLTRIGRGRRASSLIVEGSSGEAVAVAASGQKFKVSFINGQIDKIRKFRTARAHYRAFSDIEIIQLMIDLGVITPPSEEEAA